MKRAANIPIGRLIDPILVETATLSGILSLNYPAILHYLIIIMAIFNDVIIFLMYLSFLNHPIFDG